MGVASRVIPSLDDAPVSDAAARATVGGAETNHVRVLTSVFPASSAAVMTNVCSPYVRLVRLAGHGPAAVPSSAHVMLSEESMTSVAEAARDSVD